MDRKKQDLLGFLVTNLGMGGIVIFEENFGFFPALLTQRAALYFSISVAANYSGHKEEWPFMAAVVCSHRHIKAELP